MKHAESESFVKSFLVFFLSLSLFSGVAIYLEHLQKHQALENTIFNEMKLCSFNLDCTQFTFDFVPLQTDTLYQLKRDSKGLYSLFSIPGSDKYALKLHYAEAHYKERLARIHDQTLRLFFVTLLILALLSALFSVYALYPLHKALRLTEEFSRDILHDFNTPLASLRLNVSRLNLPPSEEKKRQRIEQSIETMVSLGDNLRSYLDEHPLHSGPFELHQLLRERIGIIQKLYPSIRFHLAPAKLRLHGNRDALTRIVDNLLSNAAKYNTAQGEVWVAAEPQRRLLVIKDSGKGIAHPEKIFDRFYKEHERGLGIGLNIVKKLCDTMNIAISVESTLGEGSLFSLDLTSLGEHGSSTITSTEENQ